MILKNQALTSIGYGWKIKITRGHILAVNPIKLELMGPHTHWLGLQLSDNKVTQRSNCRKIPSTCCALGFVNRIFEIEHCAFSSAKWLRDLSKLINDERETDDNTSQTPFLTCFCYIEHTHTCWGFFTCELAISMHFSDAEARSTKLIQNGLI